MLLVSTAALIHAFPSHASDGHPIPRRVSLTRSSRVVPSDAATATTTPTTDALAGIGTGIAAAGGGSGAPADRRSSLVRTDALKGVARRSSAADTLPITLDSYEKYVREERHKLETELAKLVARGAAPEEMMYVNVKIQELEWRIAELNKGAEVVAGIAERSGLEPRRPIKNPAKSEDYLFYREEGYAYLPAAISDKLIIPQNHFCASDAPINTHTTAQVLLNGENYELHRFNGICYAYNISFGIIKIQRLHDDTFLPVTKEEFLELSRKNRDQSAINYGHLYGINKKTLEAISALRDHSIENSKTNLFLDGKQIFKVIVENGTIYCIQKEQEPLFKKAHTNKLDLFNFSLFSVLIHTADVALQNCRFVPGRKKSWWACCS
jgi:hypothetical protein